jgi:hypothetical protein
MYLHKQQQVINSPGDKEKKSFARKRSMKKGNAALSILLMAVMIVSTVLPGTVWGENAADEAGTYVQGGGYWHFSD